MPRVLLAWEFGGDLGHVRRGLAIARRLRDRGHEPLLAFGDIGPFGALDDGIAWAQAPKLATPVVQDPSPLNASDILLSLGFADDAGLAGALRAWDGLFRLWMPAALIADYAPTALLAARAAGLPRVAIGSGFSEFPAGAPMPSLRPWVALDPSHLEQRDARLVASVGRAFERAFPRAPAPRHAAEVFQADAQIICTWPRFDPFGPRDDVEYFGPQDDGAHTRPVSWLTHARPRIFAYLKPRDPRFPSIVSALKEAAGEAIVAAPGLDPREAAALSGARVRVFAEPVALDETLRDADLCVNHSGAGTAAVAAALGVPQALLPMQLEQYLVARRLVETGAARMIEPDALPPRLVDWLADVAGPAARAAAQALRGEAARQPGDAAARIARVLGD